MIGASRLGPDQPLRDPPGLGDQPVSVDSPGQGLRLVGLPLRNFGTYPGSITSWQDATFPADTAFVVELPAGALSPAAVGRHAAAVLALARG